MKKLFCILLSVTMLFLFTCCSGGDEKQTQAADTSVSGDTTEIAEETEADKDKVKEGVFSSFTAATLDGEEANEGILEGKITMINIWATFCSPCIQEMPDLQKLHEAYADKGFQVVGIVCDIYEVNGVFDEDSLTEAKEIVKETGVGYLNLLPSDDLKAAKLNEVSAVPETVFVDENGNIIGQSYVGSRSYEDWAMIIDGILGQ